MSKTNEPEYGTPTEDNPEWTAERMRSALRFHQLPPHVQASARRRGPQKSPTKQMVTMRLSSDVLQALRDRGKDWQALADDALRRAFIR